MFTGNHLTRSLMAIVCDQSCAYVLSTLKKNGHGSGAANYRGAG
jgi:hypothetical protein